MAEELYASAISQPSRAGTYGVSSRALDKKMNV